MNLTVVFETESEGCLMTRTIHFGPKTSSSEVARSVGVFSVVFRTRQKTPYSTPRLDLRLPECFEKCLSPAFMSGNAHNNKIGKITKYRQQFDHFGKYAN